MNILIATDKFKDTLSSIKASNAIQEGLKGEIQEKNIKIVPVSDGGDNFSEIISKYCNAKKIKIIVSNPLFKKIEVKYFLDNINKTAFIDLYAASGLELLSFNERNPMNTSSFGTGEMIKHAISQGAKTIVIGAGGSATNDCGIGAASALGYIFFDKKGNQVSPLGRNLKKIHSINSSKVYNNLYNTKIIIATDVTNTLLGKKGAAYVYAKQKGASYREIFYLNNGLKNIAEKIKLHFDKNIKTIPGAGAAGGFGAGATFFFNAEIISGTEFFFERTNFEELVKKSDIIITGEGKIDKQTFNGKIISSIAKIAQKHSKPVIAFCGVSKISQKSAQKYGIQIVIPLFNNKVNIKKARQESYKLLIKATNTFICNFKI